MSQLTRRELLAAGAVMAAPRAIAGADTSDPRHTRSYNENMEYRRLGRTNLMLSVVSMGGHWKKIPYAPGSDEFKKNRRQVIYAALDHGVNYIDACSTAEVSVYAQAVRERRKEIYFGFDWGGARKPEIAGSLEKLKQGLDEGLRQSGLDYVDLWRLTLRAAVVHEQPEPHRPAARISY